MVRDPAAPAAPPPGPRAVAILVFDGVQSLDVTGPLVILEGTIQADFPGVLPFACSVSSPSGAFVE